MKAGLSVAIAGSVCALLLQPDMAGAADAEVRASPTCDNRHVANRDEWTRAPPQLGAKERAFVVSHIDAR